MIYTFGGITLNRGTLYFIERKQAFQENELSLITAASIGRLICMQPSVFWLLAHYIDEI